MSKIAVITGGTKGIGLRLVEKFSTNGFTVITCARTESSKPVFQSENVHFTTADLSEEEGMYAFTDFVSSKTSQIDVLINNAGIFTPGKISEEKDGVLKYMMNLNVFSAYNITRRLLDSVIVCKGHIFNLCSTASIMPYINGGSYCITKYALMGMTKVLREEMKELGVKVTAILPGATKTASWEGVDIPDERFIDPVDVAESVYSVYTLSDRTVVEEILIRPQLGDL